MHESDHSPPRSPTSCQPDPFSQKSRFLMSPPGRAPPVIRSYSRRSVGQTSSVCMYEYNTGCHPTEYLVFGTTTQNTRVRVALPRVLAVPAFVRSFVPQTRTQAYYYYLPRTYGVRVALCPPLSPGDGAMHRWMDGWQQTLLLTPYLFLPSAPLCRSHARPRCLSFSPAIHQLQAAHVKLRHQQPLYG